MEIPSEVNDPKIIRKMKEITLECKKKNKGFVTFVESPEMAKN
jgi:hypothetical protein